MARRSKQGFPPYVSKARDRHNKVRLRFRQGLFSTYLHSTYPSEQFWQEYQEALKGVRVAAGKIGASRRKPGSLAAVLAAYYVSPEFLGLRPSTKTTYRGILDRLALQHGDKPIHGIERQHIKAIIGQMADRPQAANNLLRLLRMLLGYAVDCEMIAKNPALGVKGFKVRTTGFPTWSEADIKAFETCHPIGTRARLAMALLLYTAQRRGDVVRMGWQHVRDDKISVSQGKTSQALVLRMHQALIDALAGAPRTNMTFLITEFGAPFSPAGFGNWFRECCDAAGLKGRSAHGLRKAASRRMADMGNSSKRIAAVTGHKTLKEVERYTREADQELMAGDAIATMPDRSDREQNYPNLDERLDKKNNKVLK